ncbi:hypothetical protein EBR57_09345 [bacterium]|nr:hypothetical protein [bacterium]
MPSSLRVEKGAIPSTGGITVFKRIKTEIEKIHELWSLRIKADYSIENLRGYKLVNNSGSLKFEEINTSG